MPAIVGGEIVQNSSGRSVPFFGNEVYSAEALVTLAQLNAGFVVVKAAPDITLKVVRIDLISTGVFATATDVRISDTTATPVDVVTVPIASFTNGAFIGMGTAGNTIGSYAVPLTANQGLQIRKTGSAATGGTSIRVVVIYKVNS